MDRDLVLPNDASLFIENEGALFAGFSRGWPTHVWNGDMFAPYTGTVPKPIEWGTIITANEAQVLAR